MKDPDLAQQPAAGECIREFAAQLKERGIQLLFVPLPLKPMVYPEMIDPNATEEWLTHPDAAAFYDTLRKDGVDVIDLTPDFAKLRTTRKYVHFLEANSNNRDIARQTEEDLKLKKDAFLMQDTHWTTDAMRLAAEKIAGRVKEKYAAAMRPMARTITVGGWIGSREPWRPGEAAGPEEAGRAVRYGGVLHAHRRSGHGGQARAHRACWATAS